MSSLYGIAKNCYHRIFNSGVKEFISSVVFKSRAIGFLSEVYYWDNALSLGHEYDEQILRLLDPNKRIGAFPPKLLDFINELKKHASSRVKVLEVGSGPVSTLGWGVEANIIEVVAIDPLAKQYSKIMKTKTYSYPINPIVGQGEKVGELFSGESFDVIYSRNALDHSSSPAQCINSMFKVLKEGGLVYLEGFVNVGTHEDWKGLHQHNLIPENGNLVRYDKKGSATNLTNTVKLKIIYQNKEKYAAGDWYEVVFKKYK